MCAAERKTFRRSRSGVPNTFLRTRRWRAWRSVRRFRPCLRTMIPHPFIARATIPSATQVKCGIRNAECGMTRTPGNARALLRALFRIPHSPFRIPLASGLPGLPGLAANALSRILDPLALVGFGLPHAPDARGILADDFL